MERFVLFVCWFPSKYGNPPKNIYIYIILYICTYIYMGNSRLLDSCIRNPQLIYTENGWNMGKSPIYMTCRTFILIDELSAIHWDTWFSYMLYSMVKPRKTTGVTRPTIAACNQSWLNTPLFSREKSVVRSWWHRYIPISAPLLMVKLHKSGQLLLRPHCSPLTGMMVNKRNHPKMAQHFRIVNC